MADARLVGLGTFDEVLDNPVDPYVKTLAATAARGVKRRPAPTAPRRSTAPRRPVAAGTGPRADRQENP